MMTNMKNDQPANNKKACKCPYCEEELFISNLPFCQACGVMVQYCAACKMTVSEKNATKCPVCGGPLKKGGRRMNA